MSKLITTVLLASSFLLLCFPAACSAQVSQDFGLLPSEGGVGVGKTLQMVLVNRPGTGVGQAWQNWVSPYVSWTSSDPSIARVSQSGKVTGLREGTVTITATTRFPSSVQAVHHSIVKVGSPVATLRAPHTVTIPHYCTRSIQAQPLDNSGGALNDRPVLWVSQKPEAVFIAPLPKAIPQVTNTEDPRVRSAIDTAFFHRTAMASGREVGQWRVVAESEGVKSVIIVDVVESAASSLQILPTSMELDVQEIARATVVAQNQDHCLVPGISVTWATDDPTVATVNPNTGEVQGLKAGSTTLTATAPNGLSASIGITVPKVTFILVNPAQIPELDIGQGLWPTATTFSSSGRILTHREVTWSVADSTIATVNPSVGYTTTVIGRAVGSTTVTASSEGASTSLSVTVPSVSFLVLDPSQAFELDIGEHRTITATPKSLAGTPLHNRIVTWTTSDSGVATLNPSTGYTTTATGGSEYGANSIVQALCEGKSAAVTATVPRVNIISIQPPSLTLFVTGSGQITATTKSSSGKLLPSRPVTWSVANSAVASANPISGRTTTVTGRGVGDTTVTASSEGASSPPAQIHVTSLCQQIACYSQYYIRNFDSNAVDVYDLSVSGSDPVATLEPPPGPDQVNWYLSPELTEGSIYVIRTVTSGCDVSTANCLITQDSFPGGPGGIYSIDVP